jgi:hypothetical protein
MTSKAKIKLPTELELANERIEELEERVEELEGELSSLDQFCDVGSRDEALRDQLGGLAIDCDTASAPQTQEQWRRCIESMLRGTDWRAGTWR